MLCPYCGMEMEKGSAVFLPMQGLDQMMLSYRSGAEVERGRRGARTVVLVPGTPAREAFACAACRIVVPVLGG